MSRIFFFHDIRLAGGPRAASRLKGVPKKGTPGQNCPPSKPSELTFSRAGRRAAARADGGFGLVLPAELDAGRAVHGFHDAGLLAHFEPEHVAVKQDAAGGIGHAESIA
jgi:hypothetical protein